jgi:hypothetical protein
MNEKADDTVNLTIEFTEQQMELINKLAKEKGKTVSETVSAAIMEFIRKEGSRYTA